MLVELCAFVYVNWLIEDAIEEYNGTSLRENIFQETTQSVQLFKESQKTCSKEQSITVDELTKDTKKLKRVSNSLNLRLEVDTKKPEPPRLINSASSLDNTSLSSSSSSTLEKKVRFSPVVQYFDETH